MTRKKKPRDDRLTPLDFFKIDTGVNKSILDPNYDKDMKSIERLWRLVAETPVEERMKWNGSVGTPGYLGFVHEGCGGLIVQAKKIQHVNAECTHCGEKLWVK